MRDVAVHLVTDLMAEQGNGASPWRRNHERPTESEDSAASEPDDRPRGVHRGVNQHNIRCTAADDAHDSIGQDEQCRRRRTSQHWHASRKPTKSGSQSQPEQSQQTSSDHANRAGPRPDNNDDRRDDHQQRRRVNDHGQNHSYHAVARPARHETRARPQLLEQLVAPRLESIVTASNPSTLDVWRSTARIEIPLTRLAPHNERRRLRQRRSAVRARRARLASIRRWRVSHWHVMGAPSPQDNLGPTRRETGETAVVTDCLRERIRYPEATAN